jgi:lipopolysaccharide biosynthesis protein
MKIIAFYLPQFHRIPENDSWWGKGFTEWNNTLKAIPLFKGHYQPRIPFKNNYYNLTLPEVRQWQAKLAKDFGVFGFCYYHYWFKGKRLLHKPLDGILKTGLPEFPFCLSWANEAWTRTWDGRKKDILIDQDYGDERDWREHFKFLNNVFNDSRYIKVENKPMFIIYRPGLIPRCSDMLEYWRKEAKRNGWDGIHFVETLTIFDHKNTLSCFDAQLEFEPMYTIGHHLGMINKAFRFVKKKILSAFEKWDLPIFYSLLNIISYDKIWKEILSRKRDSKTPKYLGAFTGWDNTARRKKNALIVYESTPEKFKKYLKQQIRIANNIKSEFLFVNAWNEWAEGAYLEPDDRYEYKYLEALNCALKDE